MSNHPRFEWHPLLVSLALGGALFFVIVTADAVAEWLAPTPTPYLCAEHAHPDTCSDAPEG
jgi:hypothetical protein